ncbi:MAG: hypothetical protein WD512_02900 [Candidatus Paceibacterota bacterium]
MNNFGLSDGTIFPIIENRSKTFYITNAPYEVVAASFKEVQNEYTDSSFFKTGDFIKLIELEGYEINKYVSSWEVNFDA